MHQCLYPITGIPVSPAPLVFPSRIPLTKAAKVKAEGSSARKLQLVLLLGVNSADPLPELCGWD